MSDYLFQENADIVLDDMDEFISVENSLVQKGHEFHEKLASLDLVFQHIDEELLPDETGEIHFFIGEITDLLNEISQIPEPDYKLRILHIIKDEREELKHIENDFHHKEWAAARKDIIREEHKEESSLLFEIKEIEEIHHKLQKLVYLMNQSKHLKEKISPDPKTQKYYEKTIEYYLTKIYHIIAFYEHLFRQILEKEKIIFRKIVKEI